MNNNLNILSKLSELFHKKKAIGEGALFGLIALTPTRANAQTMYKCMACPQGTLSPAGSTSSADCVSVYTKSGSQEVTDASGMLGTGWYRLSLKAAAGAKGANSTATCSKTCSRTITGGSTTPAGCSYIGYSSTSGYQYRCNYDCSTSMTCTGGGAGGAGAELFYVFYSSGEPYSMTGGNSPSLTINGEKRFWTNPGAAGGAARATSGASCSCAAGAAGTAGTQSIPSNTTNLDGLNSAGIKLMKILPALLGGYIIAKWG